MKKFYRNKRFQIFAYFSLSYIVQKLILTLSKVVDIPHSIIIKEYHLHHVFWGVVIMIISAYLMVLLYEKIKRIPNYLLFFWCWGFAWFVDEIWIVISLNAIFPIWFNLVPVFIAAILLFILSLI